MEVFLYPPYSPDLAVGNSDTVAKMALDRSPQKEENTWKRKVIE